MTDAIGDTDMRPSQLVAYKSSNTLCEREEYTPEELNFIKGVFSNIDMVHYYYFKLFDEQLKKENDPKRQDSQKALFSILNYYSIEFSITHKQRIRQYYILEQKVSNSERVQKLVKTEIWMYPTGNKHSHRISSVDVSIDDVAEDELLKLSQVELFKRFSMSYLCVHNILLTNYKINCFQQTLSQMLREFRKLLSFKLLPTMMNNLNSYVILNILAIENNDYDIIENTRNPGNYDFNIIYKNTVTMAWEMMRLIIDQCNYLLKESMTKDNGNPNNLKGGDIEVLMHTIQLWCDRLIDDTSILKSNTNYVCVGEHYWVRFADFANTLEEVKIHYRLPKHVVPIRYSKHVLDTIYCILFFVTDYLCDSRRQIFKLHKTFNDETKYISLINALCPFTDENLKTSTTDFLVEPQYIVLDTSYYINSLTEVKKLIYFFLNSQGHSYFLTVPTSVLTYLETLAKENKNNTDAKQALLLLKDKNLEAVIKFITVNDSNYNHVLKSLKNIALGNCNGYNFGYGNDNINLNVIQICLSLIELYSDRTEDTQSFTDRLSCTCSYYRDSRKKILGTFGDYRNVILLTNDDQLKEYAHSLNIPFRSIVNFLNWLNGNTN